MARPKSVIPKPFVRKRGDAYQIRWTFEDEEFAFSLGAVPKNEADITLRAVAIALANDDFWSPDLLDYPAVKRYLARKAGRDKTESDGRRLRLALLQNIFSKNFRIFPTNIRRSSGGMRSDILSLHDMHSMERQ